MRYPDSAIARKTRTYPWARPLPFNPDAPFGSGSLGVVMNTGSVAAPTAATGRYLVSTGKQPINDNGSNAAGSTQPVTNPLDLGAGYFFYEELPEADICLIRPYLVLYSSSSHTALAAAASAQGITAKLHFFFVNLADRALGNEPVEYVSEYKGSVTVSNAATRIDSTARHMPTGAQWCDASSVAGDATISPGIVEDGEVATGALRLRFDQEGSLGLLVYVSDITASAGVGWLRRHL